MLLLSLRPRPRLQIRNGLTVLTRWIARLMVPSPPTEPEVASKFTISGRVREQTTASLPLIVPSSPTTRLLQPLHLRRRSPKSVIGKAAPITIATVMELQCWVLLGAQLMGWQRARQWPL